MAKGGEGESWSKQPISAGRESPLSCRKLSECGKASALAASAAVPTSWSPWLVSLDSTSLRTQGGEEVRHHLGPSALRVEGTSLHSSGSRVMLGMKDGPCWGYVTSSPRAAVPVLAAYSDAPIDWSLWLCVCAFCIYLLL